MSKRKLVVACLIFLGGCALSPLQRLEQRLVFQPRSYPDGNYAAGSDFEDVFFQSDDGTQLHGWFTSPASPRAALLYCHGNAGNVSHRASSIRELSQRHRLAVFIFDYRGYGRSNGKPNEKGVIADAKSARNWLADRVGLAPQEIIIMGRSLGGGVAVQLAADDGAAGLVLVNTFDALPEVAAGHMPFLAPRWIMKNRFESAKRVVDYQGPLLQCHGDKDRVVPFKHGQKLFAAANEPKQFIHVRGGGHNDPLTQEFHLALSQLIDQTKNR